MKCQNCGNEYAKTFEIVMGGENYHFDSFECAINKLAPHCAQCDTRIIGHGVEGEGRIFCCAQCAKMAGVEGLNDHVS